MKKSILLLCALWGGTCKVVAQTAQWIDVTNYYIQNPSFDNNSNRGWSITSNASSKDLNYNCQEFWNGTFNIWQSIADYKMFDEICFTGGEPLLKMNFIEQVIQKAPERILTFASYLFVGDRIFDDHLCSITRSSHLFRIGRLER